MIPTLRKKQEGKEFEIKVLQKELNRNDYNGIAMYKITDRTRTQGVN
jgi:hypothetical protein